MGYFPMLVRVWNDDSFIQTMPREAVDKLGEEVTEAFKRCSVPESQVSMEERRFNEWMLNCFFKIDQQLMQRVQNASANRGDGSLLILFRKIITTATNLQAVSRMCDANIRTGYVRCRAFTAWDLFSSVSLMYTQMKFPQNDSKGNKLPPCSFEKKVITNMANVLTQNVPCNYRQSACSCKMSPWTSLQLSLTRALGTDSPTDMVELLETYDWPTILQRDNVFIMKPKMFCDSGIFHVLHQWACRALVDDPKNVKAKNLLRKLGSCHELWRTVLRRIISGEIYVPSSLGRSRLEQVANALGFFLQGFMNCLVQVPVDRETNALVRRARNALAETLHDALPDGLTSSPRNSMAHADTLSQIVVEMNNLLSSMDSWQKLNDQSEKEKWTRFRDKFLTEEQTSKAADVNFVKTLDKKSRKNLKAQYNCKEGECCANCFVLQKTLIKESKDGDGRLLKCSRCRNVKYCSLECQREHWKKAHNKHCKVVTVSSDKP